MSGLLNLLEENMEPKIVSAGEPHLACALLLDVSDSMCGEAIESLNAGIRRFKEQLASDSIYRNRVDIALITFRTQVEVISDFVPISEMPTPELSAGGCADIAKGIQTAIDLVKKRTKMYSQIGTPCYKPWIFMITSGASTSSPQEMSEAAERIRSEEEKGSHGHLSFWALGTGNYDREQLFSLTNRVMELKDFDFSGIFDWATGSIETILFAHGHRQRVEFEPLPVNVRTIEENRKIDEDWY